MFTLISEHYLLRFIDTLQEYKFLRIEEQSIDVSTRFMGSSTSRRRNFTEFTLITQTHWTAWHNGRNREGSRRSVAVNELPPFSSEMKANIHFSEWITSLMECWKLSNCGVRGYGDLRRDILFAYFHSTSMKYFTQEDSEYTWSSQTW